MDSYARTTSGRRSFAVLGLALFLLGGFGASAATLTVTEQESGRTFGLGPEDLVVVRLAECASCGYTLTPVTTPDPSVLALLSHTVTEPGAPGGSATHTWQYGAVGTGRTTAEFRYAQPWNPESARTYLFTFEVGSALKILSFAAVPPDVPPGQPSSLQWATTGGNVVVVSWQGEGPCCAVSVPANGTMTVNPKQTTTYTLDARGAGGAAVQARATVSVSAACPAPTAPEAIGPSGALPPGSAFSLSWTDALAAAEVEGTYEAQLALDDDFSRLAQARSTSERSATFTVPSEASGAVYARVRAVAACGTAGSWGNTIAVAVARPGAVVILTQGQSPAWAVRQGEPLPSATLRFRNVGAAPATVGLSASGGFFTVSPASLSLAPGQEVAVGLAGVAGASAAAGTRQGSVTAAWPEGSVTAAVTLTAAESLADTVALLDRDVVYNLASGGGVSTQAVAVTNPGNVPIRLASSPLLGGGWLTFEPQDLADPLPPGQTRTLRLRIDRSLRTAADGPPPVSTQLELFAAGAGKGRLLRVFDAEPPAVGSVGTRTPADPGSPTFVVPTAVHASGQQGALFTSDGWIRNLSAVPVTVDLLATPASGGPSLRVEQTLPPLALVRLYDFVQGLFGRTSLSANVEIRPRDLSDAAQLVVRTTAEGQPGGGKRSERYSSEIPVYASGSGTGLGRTPLLMPGIDVTANVRTNVILSETSGSPASVHLTLISPEGTPIATTPSPLHVPAWGVTQSSLQDYLGLAPGTVVRGAALLIEGAGGAGRVVALGTAIDNVSQSFRALTVSSAAAVSATARSADEPPPVVVPSIVHSPGLANTFFTTRLSVTNLSAGPAPLRFAYSYAGTDEAGAPVSGTKTVERTLGPRASLPVSQGDDAVTNLFGLPAGWSTSGALRVEGAGVPRCTVNSWVQTVDAATPESNVKYAAMPGFGPASSAVVGQGGQAALLSSGVSKVAGWRTNLILTEVSGQPARVRVRLVDGVTGLALGQTEVLALAPWEKRQVNDASLWGLLGLPTGYRERLQMVLESAGTDPGRVAGILTEIAGDGTNATLVTTFGPAGPPGPVIEF